MLEMLLQYVPQDLPEQLLNFVKKEEEKRGGGLICQVKKFYDGVKFKEETCILTVYVIKNTDGKVDILPLSDFKNVPIESILDLLDKSSMPVMVQAVMSGLPSSTIQGWAKSMIDNLEQVYEGSILFQLARKDNDINITIKVFEEKDGVKTLKHTEENTFRKYFDDFMQNPDFSQIKLF